MRQFRGTTISGRIDHGLVENVSFENCTFDNCSLGSAMRPVQRAVVRNVILRKTTQRACFIYGAIIEDADVHELNRLGDIPLLLWSAVFRHVVISGKLSGIRINNARDVRDANQTEWDAANKAFYDEVDWALDISKAEFQGSISFEAIPGSLIRRDEETQVLVRRERLEASDWWSLNFGRSAFDVCIDWFLTGSPYDDVVLAAPKRSRRFKEDLEVLTMLRREGIAQ